MNQFFTFSALVFCLISVVAGQSNSFDYFIFSQQWPGTFCQQGQCTVPTLNASFLIHGLWPQNNAGGYPSYCSGPQWDASDVSSIQSKLKLYWPSLQGSDASFWDHEWTKHGTCSAPVLTSVYSYFSSVINLYPKVNVSNVLLKNGIYPSNTKTYSPTAMKSALKSSYGYLPGIQCVSNNDKRGSTQMVEWVGLCITKDLKYMDCPSSLNWNCDSEVLLPTTNKF